MSSCPLSSLSLASVVGSSSGYRGLADVVNTNHISSGFTPGKNALTQAAIRRIHISAPCHASDADFGDTRSPERPHPEKTHAAVGWIWKRWVRALEERWHLNWRVYRSLDQLVRRGWDPILTKRGIPKEDGLKRGPGWDARIWVLAGYYRSSLLALQLSFCFEVRPLSDRLVSSAP